MNSGNEIAWKNLSKEMKNFDISKRSVNPDLFKAKCT